MQFLKLIKGVEWCSPCLMVNVYYTQWLSNKSFCHCVEKKFGKPITHHLTYANPGESY